MVVCLGVYDVYVVYVVRMLVHDLGMFMSNYVLCVWGICDRYVWNVATSMCIFVLCVYV